MFNPYVFDPVFLYGVIWLQMRENERLREEAAAREASPEEPARWEPWGEDRIANVHFVELFRMSLADFLWLADELEDELEDDAPEDPEEGDEPLSVEAQLAAGLHRLGHGSSYSTIGQLFGISKESAEIASARFVKAVPKVFRHSAIKFPPLDQPEQWEAIKQSFERRHGIPQIVGAMATTHIPLVSPPNDRWQVFMNRRRWASIVFQCVFDGDGYFTNVSGGEEGSMHNNRLFRRSRLGRSMKPPTEVPPMLPAGTFLICNAGFPRNENIIRPQAADRPVRSPTAHVVAEEAFRRMKNRFRLLLQVQSTTPAQARINTFVCMILHNILTKRDSPYLQEWEVRTTHEARFA